MLLNKNNGENEVKQRIHEKLECFTLDSIAISLVFAYAECLEKLSVVDGMENNHNSDEQQLAS